MPTHRITSHKPRKTATPQPQRHLAVCGLVFLFDGDECHGLSDLGFERTGKQICLKCPAYKRGGS